jgi:hypothetical protein
MESLTLSTPTTLSMLQISGSCTTRNSYDVPNTTKIMALPTTSMLSLLIMPHQQAQERSIIFQLSDDVSGRYDALKISSLELRSTTVAPTQVYGSRCIV